jgi:N-acetylglucosaminyldiphosphoundecaprenol N-acetyl-beta-D-mannosaminyltransferase
MAVVSAVKLLSGQKITKIAGADIHQHLLDELNRKGGSCFIWL